MEPIIVSEHLTVRELREEDIAPIVAAEIAQGWHATPDKLLERLAHVKSGRAIALAAVWDGIPVGYVSVYRDSIHGPFVDWKCPDIVDFNVLEAYRCRGIGTALMDFCEDYAAQTSDVVTLGVGLNSGYGSAQRMYIKRGYIPDGSGVWYNHQICEPYSMCENGDDLVLYLYKKLK